jgi:hypothetical protein
MKSSTTILLRFLDEYRHILTKNKYNQETFLNQLYNAKDLNWKGILVYNYELKHQIHDEFINNMLAPKTFFVGRLGVTFLFF